MTPIKKIGSGKISLLTVFAFAAIFAAIFYMHTPKVLAQNAPGCSFQELLNKNGGTPPSAQDIADCNAAAAAKTPPSTPPASGSTTLTEAQKANLVDNAAECKTGSAINQAKCKSGFLAALNGAPKSSCGGNAACETGFDAGKAALDSTGDDSAACEKNGTSGIEYLACPILRSIDGIVTSVRGFVEGQLNFKISENLNPQVKQAWAVFRILGTAVLVIVMLVTILAQASGGVGFLDAYTIRKMLPKIIAAIILIQLSWVMAIYAIQLANAFGQGIGDLLAAPFGGPDNLGLDKLIGSVGDWGPNVVVTGGLLAGILAVLLNPFGALMLGFLVFVAAMVALAVLLFRKALIIGCVIFAPVALVMWILPGTNKYYKIWSDNFLKALMLFPLIMAMITVGEIFAWIVGRPTDNSGGLFGILAVLLGFFGPYYLLPKAFGWGGSALKAASGSVTGWGNKMSEKPKSYINARKEGYADQKRRLSAERVSRGKSSLLRGDQFRSGQWDPLLGLPGSKRRERAMTDYIAKGVGSEADDVKAATTRAQHSIDNIHPDDQDDYARALARGERPNVENGRLVYKKDAAGDILKNTQGENQIESGGEASLIERQAGLNELARLGGEGNIATIQRRFNEVMQNGSAEEIAMMNKFTKDNISKLFPALPHLFKNSDYATTGDLHRTIDGLKAEDMSSLSSSGFNSIVDTLEGRISTNPNDTEARADLARLMSVYNQASANSNIAGGISADINRRMKHVSGNMPAPLPGGASDPLASVRTGAAVEIQRRVDDHGVIDDSTPVAGGGSPAPTSSNSGSSGGGGNTQQAPGTQPSGGGTTAPSGPAYTPGGGGTTAANTGQSGPAYTPGPGATPRGGNAPQTSDIGGTPIDYARMTEAVREGTQRGFESGTLHIAHPRGPETIGKGEKFEDSPLYKPQERRTRDSEDDSSPPAAPPES